jgi:BMFP domain-containing protein YqiC
MATAMPTAGRFRGKALHAAEHGGERRAACAQRSRGQDMENSRIEDIARRLFEGLPEAARTMRRDIESNFRAVLQSSLGKLDLTTREEFEVQTRVLERTGGRIEELQRRVEALEQRLRELEVAPPRPAD